MPVFESTEKMYDVLGSLFGFLLEHPDVGPKYVEANIIIKFEISNPEGFIWLTPDGITMGPSDMKPTIEMKLSGDTCHDFWLKTVSMPVALAKGLIKVKGPMPKVLKLLPLLKPAHENYARIAKEKGITV